MPIRPRIARLLVVNGQLDFIKKFWRPFDGTIVGVDHRAPDNVKSEILEFLQEQNHKQEAPIHGPFTLLWKEHYTQDGMSGFRNGLLRKLEEVVTGVHYDWVLSLDADEELTDQAYDALWKVALGPFDVCHHHLVNVFSDPGARDNPALTPGGVSRFFRLYKGVQWEYIIHESIWGSLRGKDLREANLPPEIGIRHHAWYKGTADCNSEYIRLTEKQLDFDPFAHRMMLYLAGWYRYQGDEGLRKAINYLSDAVKIAAASGFHHDYKNAPLYASLLTQLTKMLEVSLNDTDEPILTAPIDGFGTIANPIGAVREIDV